MTRRRYQWWYATGVDPVVARQYRELWCRRAGADIDELERLFPPQVAAAVEDTAWPQKLHLTCAGDIETTVVLRQQPDLLWVGDSLKLRAILTRQADFSVTVTLLEFRTGRMLREPLACDSDRRMANCFGHLVLSARPDGSQRPANLEVSVTA